MALPKLAVKNFKLEMILAGCNWCPGVQFRAMIKEIDIPPLWLALALGVAWGLSRVWSVSGLEGLGAGLILGGIGLLLSAVGSMVLARTSFVPRRDPTALVTGGLFRFSRNPIYLADAMILAGAILSWGAMLALPLIPLFMALITFRYIHDEEARLRSAFGAEYAAWAAHVPRWFWRF